MNLLHVFCLTAVLTACTSLPNDPLAHISTFTATDLQAALADARTHGDVAAMNCYSTLLSVITAAPGGSLVPPIKGAVTVFQGTRDLLRGGTGSSALAQTVNIGCAALFVDAQVTLGKLALMAMGAPGAGAGIGAGIGHLGNVLGGPPRIP